MSEARGDYDRLARVWTEVALLAAFLGVGIWLRVWRLGTQLVLGDEVWTVAAAVSHGPGYLLTHHHYTDYSIPLALWNRLLIDTIGLSEWGMRLPVVSMGLLMLPLLWIFLRRRLGSCEALAVTGVFALCPVLLLYSRFARPYIGVVLFVLLALMGWMIWMETGRVRWGVLSAISGAVAAFLNILSLPAVLSLWGAGLVQVLVGDRRDGAKEVDAAPRAGGKRSLMLVLAGALFCLLLYAPSLDSFVEVNWAKRGAGIPTLQSWWGALHFILGTRFDLVLLWLLLSAFLGARVVAKRQSWLMKVILLMVLAQAATVVATAPDLIQWSYVLGRYLIAALPGILILLGVGLATQGRLLGRWIGAKIGPTKQEAASQLAVVFLVVLPALAGPLPEIYGAANAVTSHPDHYARPVPPLRPDRFPAFYSFLSESEVTGAIVEVPWTRAYHATPYGFYQRQHGKPIRSVSHSPVFQARGVRFGSVYTVSALRDGPIPGDYVILHRRVMEEILHVNPGRHPGREQSPRDSLVKGFSRPGLRRLHGGTYRASLRACEENESLEKVYEDEWVTVFAQGEEAEKRVRRWAKSR